MNKLVTLVAATLLAASPLAFADDSASAAASDAVKANEVTQSAPEGKQMADASTDASATTAAAPAADASKDAAAEPKKMKKHHAKHHHHHHKAKNAGMAPEATTGTPAAADTGAPAEPTKSGQ